MPSNFSYVIPDKLAGMGQPGSWCSLRDDLWQLNRKGIGAIVSLTLMPVNEEAVQEAGFEAMHIPIMDMSPPNVKQIRLFVDFTHKMIDKGKAVAVHCGAGIGRTGTMLACYLVYLGESPQEAIQSVRRIRPGSIETRSQEEIIHTYAKSCKPDGDV